MVIDLTWTEMKTVVLNKNRLRYIDRDAFYLIVYNDFQCSILKDSNSDQTDFETNYKPLANKPLEEATLNTPFASKTININGVSKKLYKREHGIQANITTGTNTILFTIPYAWVKIIGVEIFYGEKLDNVDLMILDSTSGTYTGVPNYQLNQFGYAVNVAEGEYEEENAFDADLYYGMQIKIVYRSVSDKTVGINFNLSEVKS